MHICFDNLRTDESAGIVLPATQEEINATLQHAGNPEEIHIYYSVPKLPNLEEALNANCCYSGSDLSKINELAEELEGLEDWERVTLEAAIEAGLIYRADIAELLEEIERVKNGDYYLLDSVYEYEDLGRYYVEELGALEIPDSIINYFDFESYGRDLDLQNVNGAFCDDGYIVRIA